MALQTHDEKQIPGQRQTILDGENDSKIVQQK